MKADKGKFTQVDAYEAFLRDHAAKFALPALMVQAMLTFLTNSGGNEIEQTKSSRYEHVEMYLCVCVCVCVCV